MLVHTWNKVVQYLSFSKLYGVKHTILKKGIPKRFFVLCFAKTLLCCNYKFKNQKSYSLFVSFLRFMVGFLIHNCLLSYQQYCATSIDASERRGSAEIGDSTGPGRSTQRTVLTIVSHNSLETFSSCAQIRGYKEKLFSTLTSIAFLYLWVLFETKTLKHWLQGNCVQIWKDRRVHWVSHFIALLIYWISFIFFCKA